MSGDPTQVVQFLAQNDAACPTCGYSLRGCSQPCCPECGDEIRLSLHAGSSDVLVTALRYVLLAIGTRSLLVLAYWIWQSLSYYSFPGALGSLGTGWYLRMGINGVFDVAIGVLCVVALRQLTAVKVSRKFHGVARTIVWIAILIVADVVVGFAVNAFT